MISEAEARRQILERIEILPTRLVPMSRAIDRFAAVDCLATIASPRFDNSAMDGYAVAARSAKKGARLRVIGEQPAGIDRQLRLADGEAVRIFTGGPIPAGADAVVMQEDVCATDDCVEINDSASAGDFIRRRGGDLIEGQKILSRGERLTAQLLALLASQGLAEIQIGGEVRAAILSTGDELAAASEPMQPGQIYESNATLLRGLLEKCGATIASSEHVHDEPAAVTAALRRGIKQDVLIITGGVSVGARDHVKDSLTKIGAAIDLWRVAIKPGKPFLFGRAGKCAIFGLPGNPVSAFVTFLTFVRPAILRMMSASEGELSLQQLPAKLQSDVGNSGDRVHYLRGSFDGGKFTVIGAQESHALYGLSRANALLRIQPMQKFRAGDEVIVQLFP